MIDPPPVAIGHPERNAACQLATDYAVQLIEEEAHLVGWNRAEILIAICETAPKIKLKLENKQWLTSRKCERSFGRR